jgi:hypothetical protein
MGDVWDIDVYGYDGVFFAFVEVALGGVPEQVLQGGWVQVCSAVVQE